MLDTNRANNPLILGAFAPSELFSTHPEASACPVLNQPPSVLIDGSHLRGVLNDGTSEILIPPNFFFQL